MILRFKSVLVSSSVSTCVRLRIVSSLALLCNPQPNCIKPREEKEVSNGQQERRLLPSASHSGGACIGILGVVQPTLAILLQKPHMGQQSSENRRARLPSCHELWVVRCHRTGCSKCIGMLEIQKNFINTSISQPIIWIAEVHKLLSFILRASLPPVKMAPLEEPHWAPLTVGSSPCLPLILIVRTMCVHKLHLQQITSPVSVFPLWTFWQSCHQRTCFGPLLPATRVCDPESWKHGEIIGKIDL